MSEEILRFIPRHAKDMSFNEFVETKIDEIPDHLITLVVNQFIKYPNKLFVTNLIWLKKYHSNIKLDDDKVE
jgi:hypothetical protein